MIPQTLFIHNLPSQTTDAELEMIFARHGRVLKATVQAAKPSEGRRRDSVSGQVQVHADDVEQISWIMSGSWYKNKCLDVRTQAQRRGGCHERGERAIYVAHRY